MQTSHLEVTHMKTHSKHTVKQPVLVGLLSRGQHYYCISAMARRTSQVLGDQYAWRKALCSSHMIRCNSFCSFLQGGPESVTFSQIQAQRRDNLSENFALPHDIDCPNKLLLSLSWSFSLSWLCSGLFLEQIQVSLNFSFLLVLIMSHVEAF